MDEQKLKVILEAEIDDAIGYVETETVEQRTKAINYYNRYEYGNEIDGRSKIVTGEVAEVVDGALPQLMRIFTGSNDSNTPNNIAEDAVGISANNKLFNIGIG